MANKKVFTDESLETLVNKIKSYTDDSVSNVSTVEVSETEPTNKSVDLWINPTNKDVINIPEINDTTISTVDTWSSNKINNEITNLKESITNLIELLRSRYEYLEYIESTGTQYINTGILASDYPNGLNYEFTGVVSSENMSDEWLWGALDNGKRSGNLLISDSYNNLSLYVGGTSTTVKQVNLVTDAKITLTAFASSKNPGAATLTLNGVESTTSSSGLEICDMPNVNIYLLKCNGSSKIPAKAKVYNFKIKTSDGILLRNFIPCKNSSGVVGLYDQIDNKFYENAGTGEFIGN